MQRLGGVGWEVERRRRWGWCGRGIRGTRMIGSGRCRWAEWGRLAKVKGVRFIACRWDREQLTADSALGHGAGGFDERFERFRRYSGARGKSGYGHRRGYGGSASGGSDEEERVDDGDGAAGLALVEAWKRNGVVPDDALISTEDDGRMGRSFAGGGSGASAVGGMIQAEQSHGWVDERARGAPEIPDLSICGFDAGRQLPR